MNSLLTRVALVLTIAVGSGSAHGDVPVDRQEQAVQAAMAQFQLKPRYEKSLRVSPKAGTIELRFVYPPGRNVVGNGAEQVTLAGTVNLRVYDQPELAAAAWGPAAAALRHNPGPWKVTTVDHDGADMIVQASELAEPVKDKTRLSATRIVQWHRGKTVVSSLLLSVECTCDPKSKDAIVGALEKEVLAIAAFLDDRWKDAADDYWKWLETVYMPRRAKTKAAVHDIGQALSKLAQKRDKDYGEWRGYMAQGMTLFRDVVDAPDGTASPGLRMTVHLKAERDRLKKQMDGYRAEQDVLMKKAAQLMDEEIAALREDARKLGDRADVRNSVESLGGQKKLQMLTLYDLAKWYRSSELPQLIAEIREEAGFPKEIVGRLDIKAKLAMADDLDRRQWFTLISPAEFNPKDPFVGAGEDLRLIAYGMLRDHLRDIPRDAEAQEMLKLVELQFLKAAHAKVRREQAVTAEQFGQYLVKRGFDPKAPAGWGGAIWEYVSFTWGSGPLTIYAGFPEEVFGFPVPFGYDVPGANATATGLAQQGLAQFDVALTVMLRLRANGLPLDRIRQITPALLADHVGGKGKLTDIQKEHLCRDIRETFAYLGDLAALAEGKVECARGLMGQTIFDSIDVQQDWGEYLADVFSPRHLVLMFGPAGIAKVNGQWAVSGLAVTETGFVKGASEVMYGRQWLAGALRFEEMGQTVLESRGFGWLQQALKDHDKAITALKGADYLAHNASKLGAMAVLLGGTGYLADEYLDPRLAYCVQAALELGAADLFWDVLNDVAGVPMARIANRLEQLAEELRKKEARLSALMAELEQFEQKIASLEAKANPADIVTANPGLPTSFGPAQPATAAAQVLPEDVLEAWAVARERAAAAWRAGNYKEAAQALQFGKRMAAAAKKSFADLRTRAASARDLIRSKLARPATVAGNRPPQPAMAASDPSLFGKALYEVETTGPILEAADEFLATREFAKAKQEYRFAKDRAIDRQGYFVKTGQTAAAQRQEAMIAALDGRLAMLENTNSARTALERWVKTTRALKADQSISPGTLEAVVKRATSGKPGTGPTQITGSKNPVFLLEDGKGNKFIFKHLGFSTDPENEALVELVAAALGREMGIPIPAPTRVKLGAIENVQVLRPKTDPSGRQVMETVIETINADGILMPFVEGHELSNLPEAVGQAVNDQIGRIRVLRALLGDSDAHLRNVRLGADGRVWALDFGAGNLRDDGLIRQINARRGDNEYLPLVYGVAVLYRNHPLYKWPVRFDRTTWLRDVEPVITQFEKLCADGGTGLQKVLKDVIPPAQMDETLRVLLKRRAKLRQATEEYFDAVKKVSRAVPRGSDEWASREPKALAA